MTSKIHEISSCRACGSKDLTPILSLGSLYVSDFVDKYTEDNIRAPLDLFLCNAKTGGCGLLQLKHSVAPEAMYRTYWYKYGMIQTMKDALADIVKHAESLVHLSSEDIVIDIGANDGTLLRAYKNVKTVGFEPARNLIPEARAGTTKIINDFFNAPAFEREFPGKKAKVITAIAMFYDLENPNEFTADVAHLLDDNGVFIVQMTDLTSMLKLNAFDNICHEHLEYYSLLALENLLDRHGLEVFDLEFNDVNGGSIRTYVRKKEARGIKVLDGAKQRVEQQRKYEKDLRFDDRRVYDEFSESVQVQRKQLCSFIKQEVIKGKLVHVYGASTKGNTLLQYYGLGTDEIKAAAERNPAKWGKKMVGTLIPIISEEESRAQKPDYYLVLPWHFIKEFKQREAPYIRSGGALIVPLPQFEVIDAGSL